MSDIFVSYASEDRARAKVLAGALERQDWSVWWDRRIPPGKLFSQVIKEAIDEAKCIIVLWSKESVKSDWVQNEASEGARRKILVPALIDDVEIPFEFRRIQAARLVDWEGRSPHLEFDTLLEAVRAILGKPLLPQRDSEVPSRDVLNHSKPTGLETEKAWSKSQKTKVLAAICIVALIAIVSIGVFLKYLQPKTYSLTVTAVDGSVTKSPDKTSYNHGETVTVEAVPNTGYSFMNWSGDLSGSANPTVLAVDADKSITANFTAVGPTTYTPSTRGTNDSVSKTPDKASYSAGETVVVQATAEQKKPAVPEQYQEYFAHYVDKRSFSEKAINVVGLTNQDVGRSFALIAGVSHYPNMGPFQKELKPAAEDVRKLSAYLKQYEFFDEIVVLEDNSVTLDNLQYFLQIYFPKRLPKFPKSRFLFAYSGHGMAEEREGYLLKNTARSLTDKDNSINMRVLSVYIDEVIRTGHHVLVLLNSAYSGALFNKDGFGGRTKLMTKNAGAHAITSGGSGEVAWADPQVGSGSIFFEKTIAGLRGIADLNADGIVTASELALYIKQEVQISTEQRQNPLFRDISRDGSQGEFFFLSRQR